MSKACTRQGSWLELIGGLRWYDRAYNNPYSRSPSALVSEMVRVASRWVLVVTQNKHNPGMPIHRLQHRLSGEAWDHGDMDLAEPSVVSELLEAAGARVLEVGGVDLPPWPDINFQLRPPREGEPEQYPESYQHLRPGQIRRRVEETIERIHQGRAPGSAWTLFCRLWHRVECALGRRVRARAAHHPYVLAEVPRDAESR